MEPVEEFKKNVDAFLALPMEEQRRRLDEAARRAEEINQRFLNAISFTTDEARKFLQTPMTI